jgi:hypothetical protein
LTTITTPETTRPWHGAAIGIGIALVANSMILLAGNAVMDGSIQVVAAGATTASDLPAIAVVAAGVVPLLLGAAGLWLLSRVRPGGAYQVWRNIVVVLTIVSIAGPLMLEVSTGSKVALILMHLATGAAAIVGQTSASRRR